MKLQGVFRMAIKNELSHMKKFSAQLFLLAFMAGLSVILFDSCKQPEPPKGLITVVVDTASATSGKAVAGATIIVTSKGVKGPGVIKETLNTNSSGQAEIEVKLDAVVNLYAYKVTGLAAPKDSIKATGALKLESDKANKVDEVTLKLRY